MTRRLMKLVGRRDGRDVYVTTLCPPGGTRRLMRDTGLVVAGRRVFAFADCQVPACVSVLCCPRPVRRVLYVTVVFKGVGAGTVTIPIVFDSPGAFPLYQAFSWYGYIDRGSVCGNSAKYLHVHFMCGVEGWQISLVCSASTTPPHPAFNGSGFMTFLIPATKPANTCEPFHQELSEMELNLITATGDTSCFDGTGCTGASFLTVDDTPGGSGSGSGSGGDPCADFGDRALMKRIGHRDGRWAFVKACCPETAGSGSGGGCVGSVFVACFPGSVPCTFTGTFARTSGAGTCTPDPDGQTADISYNTATDEWTASGTVNGQPFDIVIHCFSGGWLASLNYDGAHIGSSGVSGPGVFTFSWTGVTMSPPDGCVFDFNASFAF